MGDEQLETPKAVIPDGSIGTVLHWPASSNFRILRSNGGSVEYVGITPVLLDDGEVRFFKSEALQRVPPRS